MTAPQCPLPVHGATQLELKGISYAYNSQPVVRNLSLRLKQGDIGCLLGPSGCGKTTVLRAIAGFENLAQGSIVLAGETVSRAGYTLSPEKRRVGMVFQDHALFPHLSVARNIAFGLKDWDKTEREERVEILLKMVGLPDTGSKYPHELSGGQQQRVALARALAPCPSLLLLDEPFSSLDVDLRERIGQEVREILKTQGTTALLVTHDQHEAFAIADEIGVMNEGEIQQWDSAYNLYHRPANRFVADFVGEGVLMPGAVLNERQVETELGTIAGEIPLECRAGCQVDVLLRPDDILHDDASTLQAEVAKKAFRGADILYTLLLPSGRTVLSLVPSHHNHAIGEKIGIRMAVDHVVTFRQNQDSELRARG
ncbi:MAG: ABC transporter ATP-binding protein [Sulfuricella sp.]|nr:ABC transporter ATP-binding protein [Sulfuricella sp.]